MVATRARTKTSLSGQVSNVPVRAQIGKAASERSRSTAKPSETSTKSRPNLVHPPSTLEDGPTKIDPEPLDRRLEIKSTLYYLISRLSSSHSTICPSQIPRRMHDLHPKVYPDWRGMMDEVRDIIWDEVRERKVEVTQGGNLIAVDEWEKGPIRVRKGPKWEERSVAWQ